MAKILIVEDDVSNADTLAELIKLFRHTPETVYSAEAATARLGAGSVPDIIVTDYVLPGIDGVQFCHRVRAVNNCGKLPIIFTTASDCDVVATISGLLDQLGPITLLRKPFDPDELCGVISKYLVRIK